MNPETEKRTVTREDQRGVAFLEFVIVFPVLVMIFLAFVDFGRYAYTKNIVEAGANRALLLASTIEGLEDEPDAVDSRHEEAVERVEQVAYDFVTSTFVTDDENGWAKLKERPTLVLPSDSVGASMRERLQAAPMQIRLQAEIIPLLPVLPPLTINGLAVGYREPSSDVSLPIPVDCLGNPAGTESFYDFCTCEGANEKWDSSARACKSCGDGGEVDLGGTMCNCADEFCQDGMGRFSYSDDVGGICRCKCADGTSAGADGKCACPSDKVPVGSGESTVCHCSGDDKFDDARCAAKYPGSTNVVATSNECGCQCGPNNCSSRPWMKQGGLGQGCECVCVNNKLKQFDNGNRCDCPNPPSCTGTWRLSRGSCQCYCSLKCPHGTVQPDCTCKCDVDDSIRSSDSCPKPPTDDPPTYEEDEGGAGE